MRGRGAIVRPPPPGSEQELLERARALAGLTLRELAEAHAVRLPASRLRGKGWSGQLLEWALGADAAALPEPDFTSLGVELKSIPMRADGVPLESTFVCAAPVLETVGLRWESSLVRRKLARVLWVPLVGDRGGEFADRVVGTPLLWSPDPEQERVLREDWEEILEQIALGEVTSVTARLGRYLQLRPKAAHSRATTWTTDREGSRRPANPRGFYLRAAFTRTLFAASQAAARGSGP